MTCQTCNGSGRVELLKHCPACLGTGRDKAELMRAIRHFERQLAEALGLGGPEHPAAAVIRQTFGELPAMRWELRDRLWPAGGAPD